MITYKKTLSILHLLHTINETSAAYNEHCLATADKHNIAICTYFKSNISPSARLTVFEGDNTLPGFFHNLSSALDHNKYDIIHAHSLYVAFFFWLAASFRYKGLMPRTVCTVHSSFQNYRKVRHRLMLMPVFASFARLVCCSKASYASVPDLYRRLAGNRICFVQNGVDLKRVDLFADRKTSHTVNSDFVVVTVGRLIDIKNPLAVLASFKKGGDRTSRLIFIGDGNLRDQIAIGSESLGLAGRVDLAGLIPRKEVYTQLNRANLFISTSYVEGLPVAVLEAMACRCPVLLSDIAPHREIAEGVNFIPLVEPDDVVGFARELRRFQSMSNLERAKIGEKCRRLVEDRFSLPTMRKGYETLYRQLLPRNAASST